MKVGKVKFTITFKQKRLDDPQTSGRLLQRYAVWQLRKRGISKEMIIGAPTMLVGHNGDDFIQNKITALFNVEYFMLD